MEKSLAGGLNICRPKPLSYKNGTTLGLTMMSDLHIGASNVDYNLIKRELKEAADNGDRILLNGDIFDLILTRDGKRFSQHALHPRLHGRQDLINAALEWGVELLKPYAHLIDLIAIGNHETKITQHHDLDVIVLLISELEHSLTDEHSSHVIHYGGYGGFVDYRFRYVSNERSHGKRMVIHYYHGSGGASPSNKGMSDFVKRHWVEADVLWMGHKHNKFNASVSVVKCPQMGDGLIHKDVRYVMTGAYMDIYGSQRQTDIRKSGSRSNYAAEAGFSPQGKGGARLVATFGAHDAPYRLHVVQ